MTGPIAAPGGRRAPADSPPFPGGVGITRLRVYDWPAADGLAGGTPHCHTACTEAYAVTAGHGRVQTLGGDGFTETPLAPGSFVWFTPGTIHRLVNDSGDLEIVVVMQNAGLPEAGDMVLTLPDHLLADPARYESAATLPPGAVTDDGDPAPARARRDLALEGFADLLAHLDRAGALAAFHARATALIRPRAEAWRSVWANGPKAAADATAAHLEALGRGDGAHLAASSVHALPPPPDVRRMGCCGTLGVHVPSS